MESNLKNAPTERSANTISTGLLPSALGVGGKSRQNDMDVAFQITIFTGVDSNSEGTVGSGSGFFGSQLGQNNGAGGNSINVRQAYLTFGDASWGSIKAGRDLGVFGSEAILSDMTLLGVGVGAGGNGSSTLGRIGSGYLYADWVGQIAYTSPNWNGFQFTAAARQPWGNSANSDLGFDAKAVYSWTGDVSGKVWVGGLTQKTRESGLRDDAGNIAYAGDTSPLATNTDLTGTAFDNRAHAWEIGANINVEKANFVAYYYDGENMGLNGYARANTIATGLTIANNNIDSDVKGGYVQATYVIPTGTKLGASYGVSKIDSNATATTKEFESKSWIVGAYHPLTKSLNLVAEYTHNKLENINGTDNLDGKAKTVALGAILFF